MKIDNRRLLDITPYERNPRLNDAAVEAVANSIREFGFRQPIVVDAEGVIVCGHTRWKAAQRLEPTTSCMPCSRSTIPRRLNDAIAGVCGLQAMQP